MRKQTHEKRFDDSSLFSPTRRFDDDDACVCHRSRGMRPKAASPVSCVSMERMGSRRRRTGSGADVEWGCKRLATVSERTHDTPAARQSSPASLDVFFSHFLQTIVVGPRGVGREGLAEGQRAACGEGNLGKLRREDGSCCRTARLGGERRRWSKRWPRIPMLLS